VLVGDEKLVNLAHLAAELVRPESDEKRVADRVLVDLQGDSPSAPGLTP
jgi:hypothetical protein